MSKEDPAPVDSPPDAEGAPRREGKRLRKLREVLARQSSMLACAAAIIWLGSVFLLGLGWGPGLMGAGIILLIEQRARRHFGIDHDLYWTAAGALALIGGMLLESGYDLRIGPVILILIGILAMISAFSQQGDLPENGGRGDDEG